MGTMPAGRVTGAPALEAVERIILLLRGTRVILDADLARIYGVPTFRFNEAIRRNLARFPSDFMFRLTREEWIALRALRSQFAILNDAPGSTSQETASKSGRGRHRKYLPLAFTEHGALMATNLLRSPRAVAMSVFVIRAFVRMRERLTANETILHHLSEIDRKLLTHNAALQDIYRKLRPLLAPPPEPPRKQIGFHVRESRARYFGSIHFFLS